MRIVQIDDEYIDLLRKEFPSVMDGKRFHRSHSRKYIGVIFTIGEFNYYAPFSSPKAKDYDSDGSIKKDSIFALHMVKGDNNGSKALLGTIKLINMIPVPMKYVLGYSIEDETDVNYQAITCDEFKWISENQGKITTKAKQLYHFKENEKELKNPGNAKVYEIILPFKEIEAFILNNNLL